MKSYESVFSVGPEPEKQDRKKKVLIEFANMCLCVLNWPLAKIAAMSRGLSKLIYTSQVESFSNQNKKAYIRYEMLWKKVCEKNFHYVNFREYAIVMQGQIDKKDDFTVNTLLYYRKIYPDANIILSTWDDEPKEIIEELEAKGIHCILNKYPDRNEFGRGNLNLQLITTVNGIRKAQDLPAIKYILKTRTDQRIYMRNFLQYFSDLLKVFKCGGSKQNQRMIFMNCEGASTKYYPFKLSDMLVFGDKTDVFKLYDIPHTKIEKDTDLTEYEKKYNPTVEKLYEMDFVSQYTASEIEGIIPNYKDLIEYKMKATAELYIISQYISKNIVNLKKTTDYLTVYLSFLKDYAIIVDKTAIELYWKKYHHQYKKIQNYQMQGQLDHAAWLEIYLNYRREPK